jgi:urease accessory protein
MRRAIDVKTAGNWNAGDEVDRVVLDATDRHRRRLVLTSESGDKVLLDLPRATVIGDGDALVLEDGAIVRVLGAAEPLAEIAAATPEDFVRLAWHLGNRHTDVQILERKLRMRRDHVLEDMAARLGATITPIAAPFDPEPAAPHGHDAHDHAGAHHHETADRHDR